MKLLIFRSFIFCLLFSVNLKAQSNIAPNSIIAANDLDTVFNYERLRIPILNNDKIEGKIARIIVTPGKYGRSMLNLDNTVTYIPKEDFCGKVDQFDYLICTAEKCDTATIEVYLPCEDLTIITGFSPNSEWNQNTFTVMGLDKYKDHRLSIFSKSGGRVYFSQNYQNDWDGTYKNQPLERGTYYYVLKTEESEPFQGYVTIE